MKISILNCVPISVLHSVGCKLFNFYEMTSYFAIRDYLYFIIYGILIKEDFNRTPYFIFVANSFQHFVTTETFQLKQKSKTFALYYT